MSTEPAIGRCIDAAADSVGSVWPLHSFVTANPLAGFEDRPFHEAVADAEWLLGGDGYPSAAAFRRALESGQIDRAVLRTELSAHGYDADPEASLDQLAARDSAGAPESPTTATERVDAVLTKWLGAFLDQGRAEWPMPNREQGFYAAFRAVAPHDGEIPDGDAIAALPDRPADAIRCLELDRDYVGGHSSSSTNTRAGAPSPFARRIGITYVVNVSGRPSQFTTFSTMTLSASSSV